MVTEGLLARGTAVFTGLIRCARRGTPVMSRRILLNMGTSRALLVFGTGSIRMIPFVPQRILHDDIAS